MVQRIIQKLIRSVNYISCALMVVMLLLIVVDVLLRYLFTRPIAGSVELVELMLVVIVFLGIAFTGVQKGHVALDLVVKRLSERPRAFVFGITSALSLVTFSLIVWQSIVQSGWVQGKDIITRVWKIPVFPIYYVIAFGSLLLCIAILLEFSKYPSNGTRNSTSIRLRAIPLGLTIFLLTIGLIWSGDLSGINPITFGICVGFPLLFLLLFAGMPIGFTLAFIGFIGMSYLRGTDAGFQALRTATFATAGKYAFSVIPLFILMGEAAFFTKMSRDLYDTAYKWLGSLHGGLSMATVMACAGFAAICGDSLATAMTMSTVALPEMKRYKYDPGLATGCIAAAGSLGVLIPPSLVFVLYALLTNESIGDLFVAGIVPGILLAGLFMLYIYIRVRVKPSLGPPSPTVKFKDKLTSTRSSWPILFVFLVVIGGIYTGAFSPTEAGAIGAFIILVLGLLRRRLNFKTLTGSLLATVKLTCMGFTILIGASIFGYFLAVSKVPMEMANFVIALPLSSTGILILILAIYLILGCVMPAIPLVILITPIIFPSVIALGFNPIWFGVITVLMFEAAVITPPIGINVFGIAGVAKDIPMETIFRGILPFLLCVFVAVAILIAFPSIATFLPALLR